jgi:hypothetical protein
MNWRWKMRKSASSGAITRSGPAITSVYCAPVSPIFGSVFNPTGTGAAAV